MNGGVSDVACLLQTVESFEKFAHPDLDVWISGVHKAFGLLHEQLGVNNAIEIGIVNINCK